MALSSQELGEIRAQWEEWVPDGFELDIEVRTAAVSLQVEVGDVNPGELVARAETELYCQVEVWALEASPDQSAIADAFAVPERMVAPRGRCVFSERVPHDAGALRASVTVLARTIAKRQEAGDV